MILVYGDSAMADLRRIASWYRRKRPEGLEPFFRRFREAIKRIERTPTAFLVALERSGRMVRRARILRSDYSIAFEIQTNETVVLAVIHGARDPDEWNRLLE